MIAFVNGRVAALEDNELVVEIGGVGLSVAVPLTMLQPRPAVGEQIMLYTHLQVREDAWTLYGFTDREQLRLFRLLINVSGGGAKTALAVVDTIAARRFAAVIAAQDVKPLTAVSGVGKKTAERILLELKDKFALPAGIEPGEGLELPMVADEVDKDLLAALRQLGYSATESRSFALQAQSQLGAGAGTERLLREALRIAMKS